MLGTVVLTLRHNPSRDVGNTHRRFRTVNVLTTRTGGTVNVNTQIRRVDIDINIIINFRINKRRAERRMATSAGVERTLTNQTVYAGFSTQPTVRIFASNSDGYGFNTRHFTFRLFNNFSLEAARFSPTQIHAHQHACPVLRFRTARTCLNIEIAICAVIFTGEHTTEFQLGQLIFQRVEFCYGFVKGFFVVGFYSQFQQAGDIFQALAHLIERINDGFKRRTLFTQRLRAFGFVPYVRLFQLGVYFFQTLFLGIIVKDTP